MRQCSELHPSFLFLSFLLLFKQSIIIWCLIFFFLNRVSLWPGTHCVTQTFNSICPCLPPHPYCYLAVYCLFIYVFCQGFTLKSRLACLVLTKRLRLDSFCLCLKSAETTSVGLQSTHWAESHPSRRIFQQVEESREWRKRLEEGPIWRSWPWRKGLCSTIQRKKSCGDSLRDSEEIVENPQIHHSY